MAYVLISGILLYGPKITYTNFSDKNGLYANSEDSDQTAPVKGSTLFAIPPNILGTKKKKTTTKFRPNSVD